MREFSKDWFYFVLCVTQFQHAEIKFTIFIVFQALLSAVLA